MEMSRFQFLQSDFLDLFALCEQADKADDMNFALLKIRMALENIVKDLGATQGDLFSNINELNDQEILDAKRTDLFHQIRHISNLGVHEGNTVKKSDVRSCLDSLFEITLWYAISIKRNRYELSEFQTYDMELAKQYLNEIASDGASFASSGHTNNSFNNIDPLQINGDFSKQLKKNREINELDQDVFETDEEYAKRIASMPKVHMGYAILDPQREDGYTKTVFPLHHIDHNKCIQSVNNIRAFYAENIRQNGIIDDELVAGLRVFNKKIYYNYNTIALKHGKKEIPMHPICWEKFPYETNTDFQNRIEKMPILPLGVCVPNRSSYNIHTQDLSFFIEPYAYVKEKITSQNITLKIDRDTARKICDVDRPYRIFGQFKKDGNIFILWDKELGAFYDDTKVSITSERNQENSSAKQHETGGYCQNNSDLYYSYWGRDVKQNSQEEKDRCHEIAEQGDKYLGENLKNSSNEQYEMGRKFHESQNYPEAEKWYRKAAEQGNAKAQYNLGNCYCLGEGVKHNYKEAIKWYRKAAEQGNADAQYSLGNCYCFGQGLEQNYQEAAKWYYKAAKQGNANAQYHLGWCYDWGQGIEQNYTEAEKWYQEAAKNGSKDAKEKLKNLAKEQYEKGKKLYANYNYQEAVKWYCKAAEKGNASAQTELGFCYERGGGIAQNYTEAVKWYRKAAEQGYPLAQYRLGLCYADGNGVGKDKTEAIKWYKKAAYQGNEDARSKLAACHADKTAQSGTPDWAYNIAKNGYSASKNDFTKFH